MGCPPTPLSCLTPENIFAGVYRPNCGGFADPSNFKAERAIFNSQFGELINNYGVEIDYYVNTFNPKAMNSIYGEHTLMYWLGPTVIKAYIQMENASPIYALAGMDSPDTLTLYLHIDDFNVKFAGLSVFDGVLRDENNNPILTEAGEQIIIDQENGPWACEPKSQDKIKVTPFGCDRVNGRGAKIFEVTEVMDEDAAELNPAMGHYVWRVKAVRSEHNFITNEPRENMNHQIADNSFFGKLYSTMFPELTGMYPGLSAAFLSLSSVLDDNKIYTESSDEIVQRDVFPPSTGGSDGSVYGNYF
jgi:hypothetical protein